MAGGAAPKAANAAIDIAFAAASQDGLPDGFALFEIALRMGAGLNACAGAFAASGAPALLAKSLELGADPRAEISLQDESPREPSGLGGRPTSVARRAFFSGCPACAQIVADAGVDPLASPPRAKGRLAGEHELLPFGTAISLTMGPGGGSWSAILALLSKSSVNAKSASIVARDLLAPALLSIGAGSAGAPLAAMRRLRELGASFEETRESRLAQDLWREASGAIARSPGSDPQRMRALRLAADFAAEADPKGMGHHFIAALSAATKRPGGWGSRLPESPLGEALKGQAIALAKACAPECSAAKSIMAHGLAFDMDGSQKSSWAGGEFPASWVRKGAPSMDLCCTSRDLQWLMEETAKGDWLRPSPEELELLAKMATACLCASGMLFATETEWGRGPQESGRAEEAWLAEAARLETVSPLGRGAEFPLGCAKIAAASEPFLASIIQAVAPTAARLARPGLSAAERESLCEAAKIAATAPRKNAASAAMRL